MADTLLNSETHYTLTEDAILAHPWLSVSTFPDALTRPSVAMSPAGLESPKILIRTRGQRAPVEIRVNRLMPHSFLKSAEDAIDLLRLPDGWNSYSAKPVPRQTVIRAVCLLAEFLDEETPTPSVVPTVRGGIQIEWHTKGFDIEIYVESATSVSFYAEHLESGESCETPLAGNHHLLRSWLERISGK